MNYFTTRGQTRLRIPFAPGRPIVETFELTPVDGGTELTWRLRFVGRGFVSMVTLRLIKLMFRGGIGRGREKLLLAMAEDLSKIAPAGG
jgi:hypothetical protein